MTGAKVTSKSHFRLPRASPGVAPAVLDVFANIAVFEDADEMM